MLNAKFITNTIKLVASHNKYLEEKEMWKKRNEELNVGNTNVTVKSSNREIRRSETVKQFDVNKINGQEYGPSLKLFLSSDKWDHKGFEELYPNENLNNFDKKSDEKNSSDKKKKKKKRDISTSSSSSSSSSNLQSKSNNKKKKRKHIDSSSFSIITSPSSSSTSELRSSKKHKKKKSKKHSNRLSKKKKTK